MEVLSMEYSGEDLEFVGANDDHNMSIITTKRKRTKRPRPTSPAVTSASSSGGGGDQFSVPSTMSSSDDDDHFLDEESATEEEDMAKCLILLAQGGSRKNKRKNDDIDDTNLSVYECRTCNRRFPSFQALGGHRASHKKPKPAAAEDKKPPAAAVEYAVEEGAGKHKKIATLNSLSLHFGGNKSSIATKVHECSICGLEFPSGQALGGHMRRHRANMMSATAIATESRAVEEKPPRKILTLDLNLPAPEDDHSIRDLPFHHFATTPTLVHCHY